MVSVISFYIYLKCLRRIGTISCLNIWLNSSLKLHGPGLRFVGKFLSMDSRTLNRYSVLVICFFFSEPVACVILVLNTFNLSCQNFCHKVICDVIFSYYSSNDYKIYNDVPFFIPDIDIDNFCPSTFLLNLARVLSNFAPFKKSDFCFINFLNYLLAFYFFDLHS